LEKNEKITRLKFVAKEREELLEPVEAVINYLKLENRITRLSNKKYQKDRFVYFKFKLFYLLYFIIINI